MRLVAIFQLCLLAALSSGCAVVMERPALEDLGMIGVMGFDYLNPRQAKIVVTLPEPSKEAKEKTQMYKTIAAFPNEALMTLSPKSEKTMSLAQLRVVLFSEEYARKVGIREVIENLYRNPAVGDNVFVAIVKGSVEGLMGAKYENKPEINQFLNDLLHPRRDTAFHSFLTIHDTIFRLHGETSDLDLPYLEQQQGDIQITKIALFKRDKLIGFLTDREGKINQAIRARLQLPDMNFTITEEDTGKKHVEIVVDFVTSDSKVKVHGGVEAPSFQIDMKIYARVLAYTGRRDLENPDEWVKVEKDLEHELDRQGLELLKKLQKLGVEPANLTDYVRAKYHGEWHKEMAEKAFANAKFAVHTDFVVIGFGTLQTSSIEPDSMLALGRNQGMQQALGHIPLQTIQMGN
ncbi:Ger(x)C family spore germination protein [Brevibacillus migulae]|uniref:Ger(x)C family spore germination protein n=1 Tax=Brevibacillus migulae TaxID=1644114 RepID=UPI001F328576|nr:Ger(x)C family spore germination protein [Brevibacillus migulae]